MNTYLIREIDVRPIESSLDRVAVAPSEDAAIAAWCAATGQAEPYSVELVPPFETLNRYERHALQTVERL